MFNNILLMTDSYKVTHAPQYPKGTRRVYSYLEARRGGEFSETVFFGLQYFVERYLKGKVVTREKIERAAKFFESHFGNGSLFNRDGWEHILEEHDGHLPVEIYAVPEGTVVPEGNVLMTIENTCDHCFWLTNYLETLLVQVWYPSTTATISRELKRVIGKALEESGDDSSENLMFRLHDFGYRGVSSPESAALGGAGHLVNFMGTDTLAACELLGEFYGEPMAGFSIPASEHSTMTSWGEDGEERAFANMLEQYPSGPVACVSDSWDIMRACRELWGKNLKAQVIAREGFLVVRPDSGEPTEIVPEVIASLGEAFGFTKNIKGYKVLHPKVRVIQGDGVTRRTLGKILSAVMRAGWSADNLSFGSGGGLLQDCNRDTSRYAMKCSLALIGDEWVDVFKRPATDPSKNSKRGRLMLVRDEALESIDGSPWKTLPFGTPGHTDELVKVFRNGELLVRHNLSEIRARAEITAS